MKVPAKLIRKREDGTEEVVEESPPRSPIPAREDGARDAKQALEENPLESAFLEWKRVEKEWANTSGQGKNVIGGLAYWYEGYISTFKDYFGKRENWSRLNPDTDNTPGIEYTDRDGIRDFKAKKQAEDAAKATAPGRVLKMPEQDYRQPSMQEYLDEYNRVLSSARGEFLGGRTPAGQDACAYRYPMGKRNLYICIGPDMMQGKAYEDIRPVQVCEKEAGVFTALFTDGHRASVKCCPTFLEYDENRKDEEDREA